MYIQLASSSRENYILPTGTANHLHLGELLADIGNLLYRGYRVSAIIYLQSPSVSLL
jgi:hypothetical protein